MSTPAAADHRARVRPPAVAGMFYPDDPAELMAMIDGFLASVPDGRGGERPEPVSSDRPIPRAVIAPHAGYIYSGPVAASVYARLRTAAASAAITRVVVLGPAHRVAVRSMALSSADAWRTPLGDVPIDAAGRSLIQGMPGVVVDDRAHAPEHSIEVHVPFLQRVLGEGWSLLPIVVGHARPAEVADVLDAVWAADGTLVVVSTDLSHYNRYDVARQLDRETAAAIVAGSTDITPEQACGAFPVRGVLTAAGRHRFTVELVDLRNSGDTAGPHDRVVGYGAFVVA